MGFGFWGFGLGVLSFEFCVLFGLWGLEELFEFLLGGELDEVAGDEKVVFEAAGGVFYFGFIVMGAEDDADGGLVVGLHEGIADVIRVEVHLPCICIGKFPGFKFYQYMAF